MELRPATEENSKHARPGRLVFAQQGGATREINISGNQVLVVLAASFCLTVPLVWAFVKYWLFAP
jgi:hypothetical protein